MGAGAAIVRRGSELGGGSDPPRAQVGGPSSPHGSVACDAAGARDSPHRIKPGLERLSIEGDPQSRNAPGGRHSEWNHPRVRRLRGAHRFAKPRGHDSRAGHASGRSLCLHGLWRPHQRGEDVPPHRQLPKLRQLRAVASRGCRPPRRAGRRLRTGHTGHTGAARPAASSRLSCRWR